MTKPIVTTPKTQRKPIVKAEESPLSSYSIIFELDNSLHAHYKHGGQYSYVEARDAKKLAEERINSLLSTQRTQLIEEVMEWAKDGSQWMIDRDDLFRFLSKLKKNDLT